MKMNRVSRWLVLLVTLLLPLSYFTPVWNIQLWAPQYPEGLEMQIWINRISGSVETINGLNHYIGMAKIEQAMFPEFQYLPYLVAGIIALGAVTFISNKRSMLSVFTAVMILFAAAAMVDMYQWGYKYGHNLDPHAAIKVEGMSYQPPLIGYKQLLNFTALSMPDTGGWILLGSGVMLILAWFLSRRASVVSPKRSFVFAATVLSAMIFTACQSDMEKIRYGTDACDHCGMKLVDNRFGSEIITAKGKAYKFDDVICMINYQKETKAEIRSRYVTDFSNPGVLTDVSKAYFLKSGSLESPMGGKTACFASHDSLLKYSGVFKGEQLTFDALTKSFDR